MSLSTYSYGLSFLLFSSVFAISSGFLMIMPIYGDTLFFGKDDAVNKSLMIMVATIILFLANITFCMALSTFFSDSKVANSIGSLYLVVPVIILL